MFSNIFQEHVPLNTTPKHIHIQSKLIKIIDILVLTPPPPDMKQRQAIWPPKFVIGGESLHGGAFFSSKTTMISKCAKKILGLCPSSL